MKSLQSTISKLKSIIGIVSPKALFALGVGIAGFLARSVLDIILSDWWHISFMPWVRSVSSVSHALVLLVFLLLAGLVAITVRLLMERQKLSERNAILQSHLHNLTSTVVERDARVQRAQNDMLDGMLRKTENTVQTLVGVVQEIWQGARDIDALTVKVLEESIHHIAALYAGRITRGLILVPDPRDPNWLMCYASVGIDPPSTHRRHYIGPPDGLTKAGQYKPGVAGEVYLQRVSGRPILHHTGTANVRQ